MLRKLKEAGFQTTGDEEEKIGFVEVTSKTLLKEGQIEYAVEVNVDIPIPSIKSGLEDALSNPDSPKYLVIVDIALAKASRRVLGIKKMPSKGLTGYEEEANPEYNIVQNQIINARLKVHRASMSQMSADSQYCTGLACLVKTVGQIAAQAVVTKAQENLTKSMTKLGNAPQMLKHPIYAKYTFDKASIKASKVMTVHYYVLDRIEKIL